MSVQIIGPKLNFDPADQIHGLARAVYAAKYGEEILIPPSTLRAWWTHNDQIFWLAMTDETLVGYVSLLPLNVTAFERTIAPDFDENQDVTPDQIAAYDKPGQYSAFLSSIVVREEYRGTGVSRQLRLGVLKSLSQLWAEGKCVSRLSAEVLSTEGQAMVRSLGMEFLMESQAQTKLFYGELTAQRIDDLMQMLEARSQT
jgi:GNAT superfamily N-acetyltransferase